MIGLSPLLALLLVTARPAISADTLGDVSPRVAVVEFEGPTTGGSILLGELATQVALELERGEVLRVRVPFSYSGPEPEQASLNFDLSAGKARLLEWEPNGLRERWERLPAGLRGRPIPAPGGIRSRPTTLGFVIVASALMLAALLRSKPKLSLLVAAGAGALLCFLPVVERVGSSTAIVIEGDGASGRFVQVRVQPRSVVLDLDRLLRLGVVPADTKASWSVLVDSRGRTTWRAAVPPIRGGRLIAVESFDGPILGAGLASTALAFRSTWLRPASSGAPLEARGPWPIGETLPEQALAAASMPPGWLAAGLPPGVTVFLGQLDEPGQPGAWVRILSP